MARNVGKTVWQTVSGSILCLVMFLITLLNLAHTAHTQEIPTTIQGIFLQTSQELASDPEGEWMIEFLYPITNQMTGYTITADTSITIDTIGSDFVCFNIAGMGVDYRSCIPYTNIATITQKRETPEN
ncbi:MAG: hypothetical protein MUF87_16810 [Anaerolineae bacterium]|jgi:hypothetical protein|nr:hypothetical protein [Anaerolineae bacterium]